MAYKTPDMIKKCLEVIRGDKSIVFIEDIIVSVPFSKATFYNYKLDELDDIKEALEANKIKTKNTLRKSWAISKSPVLQIALYKLIATDEEYDRLNTQKLDHSNKGEKFDFNPMSDDELASKINAYLAAKAGSGDTA